MTGEILTTLIRNLFLLIYREVIKEVSKDRCFELLFSGARRLLTCKIIKLK